MQRHKHLTFSPFFFSPLIRPVNHRLNLNIWLTSSFQRSDDRTEMILLLRLSICKASAVIFVRWSEPPSDLSLIRLFETRQGSVFSRFVRQSETIWSNCEVVPHKKCSASSHSSSFIIPVFGCRLSDKQLGPHQLLHPVSHVWFVMSDVWSRRVAD